MAQALGIPHAVEISVAELRIHVGASGVDERGKPKENLALYPDFKRRAIRPAIDEINKRTDLRERVTFSEIKANGSKAVERLRFSISTKAGRPDVELLPLAPPPQLELGLENGSADLLNDVCERFGLNETQRQKVKSYVLERGGAYLQEKLAVVTQEP